MASCTPEQLRFLIEFHLREGFIGERIEFQLAQLTAVQINKARKKGAKATRTSDLLPYADSWASVRKKQIAQEKGAEFAEEIETFRSEFANAGFKVVRRERK